MSSYLQQQVQGIGCAVNSTSNSSCILPNNLVVKRPQYTLYCGDRFLKCLEGWKQKLVEAGYESIVFEDPLDMLLQQVS